MVKDRLPSLKLAQRSSSLSTHEAVCVDFSMTSSEICQFLGKVERIQSEIDTINTTIDDIRRLSSIMLLLPRGNEQGISEVEDRKVTVSRTIKQVQSHIKVDKEATSEELENLLEKDGAAIFVDNIVADTLEAQLALANVKARHEEILKVENSIQEIRDIFVQLATLVETEGDRMNRIDFHVTKTGGYTDHGATKLQKKRKKKRKQRKRNFICIVVLMIIIGILIILLIIQGH